MIRPTRAIVLGAAFSLASFGAQLSASPHAEAQWLPDRAYTEGPGIRVGDLELHPGVAVRGGYDSNVFRQPDTQAYDRVGSAILAISPHLNLTTLGTKRMAQGEDAAGAGAPTLPVIGFNLGVSATYLHYFDKDAPKNAEVDLDTALSVLPERKIGFDVGLSVARNTRPFTVNLGGGNNDYAMDRLRPRFVLRGQSHGGVLQGRIGFAPSFTLFEGDAFKYLKQYQYEVPAGLAWKFLPSTALIYDGSYAFTDYPTKDEGGRASILLTNNQRFQSRLGVNGAVTPNIAVRVLAGYALVTQKDSRLDDHEDVVGEAAVTFAWSRKDNVELGYQRQLEVSNLSGWNQIDRGYLKNAMLFGGVFAVNLEGGLAHVNYGQLRGPNGDALGADAAGAATVTKREDIRVDAGVHLEYRATDWLAIMADYSFIATITDFEYFRGVMIPIYPGEFLAHQVFGGVRAHY